MIEDTKYILTYLSIPHVVEEWCLWDKVLRVVDSTIILFIEDGNPEPEWPNQTLLETISLTYA